MCSRRPLTHTLGFLVPSFSEVTNISIGQSFVIKVGGSSSMLHKLNLVCSKHPNPVSNVHIRNTTKIAVQVLALNFALFALLLSFSLNYELIIYFHFCASFNHMNSTSLSFFEFSELLHPYCCLLNIYIIYLHFHLSGGTSDITMSVLHESLMFLFPYASLGFLMVSFPHASLGFLRVPA